MSFCNEIDKISQDVYSHLTNIFSYKLSMAEIGITDYIILRIVDFNHSTPSPTIKIYKAKNEKMYGNDIDLFLQLPTGKFRWYALQAKVLSHNGRYKDLKYKPRKSKQQWDLLLDHETKYKSKGLYLLYNGHPKKHTLPAPIHGNCNSPAAYNLYGLALVDRGLVASNASISTHPTLAINDFFPNDMYPFSTLFCCSSIDFDPYFNYSGDEFDEKDLKTSTFYKLISGLASEDENEQNDLNLGNAHYRIVVYNSDTKLR